ncbi:hypothetical protein ACPSYH_10665 [Yersinia pestis]
MKRPIHLYYYRAMLRRLVISIMLVMFYLLAALQLLLTYLR